MPVVIPEYQDDYALRLMKRSWVEEEASKVTEIKEMKRQKYPQERIKKGSICPVIVNGGRVQSDQDTSLFTLLW